MSPSATPATQNEGRCLQVPRLPPETKVDVTKRLAWHAKWKSMLLSATPATQSGGPWSPSATPATQSDGPCRQVPRLPRKQPRRPRRQLGTKRATRASPVCQCHKCHACHAECTYMPPSAAPAMQNARTGRQVPRLPRKQRRGPRRQLGTKRATRASPVCQCHKCHACHAECTYMSPSAARRMHVHVSKYHACHANSGGVHGVNWELSAPPEPAQCASAISATPATQNARTCLQVPHLPRRMHAHVAKYNACQATSGGVHGATGNQVRHQQCASAISATPATQNARTSCVWTSCVRTSCV